jgi:hypothetical protein
MTPAQEALAGLMSDISEREFCAGWMMGLEHALWHMVTKRLMKHDGYRVTTEELDRLQELSELAGGWIKWTPWCERERGAEGETFVPMAEWLSEVAASQPS